ncbi:MAG: hypothetical protein F4X87_09270 [Chloroflexi bacterium]|nr:hypothetical protein [Chloroflexota bacterium]
MAVLVWSEREGALGNSIRSGRHVALSAEEYRPEAEALDLQLDAVLDMAWHALTLITKHENGKARFDSFEQVWVLGRAVQNSEVLRHEALQREERFFLWQALAPKAWYGIRHDATREPCWRVLIPRNATKWHKLPKDPKSYRFLDIGFWLREQQLHDAGEVFGWKYSNAYDLYACTSLRSYELRRAMLHWLRRQSPEVREVFAKSVRGSGFDIFQKALQKRFPARGPGSALLPQHYPEDELRAIVCQTLDAARDVHFPPAEQ